MMAKILARGWAHGCLRGKTGKRHHGDQAWLLSLPGIKSRQARLEVETRASEGISLSVLDCVSGKPRCGVLRVDCIAKGIRVDKIKWGWAGCLGCILEHHFMIGWIFGPLIKVAYHSR